jgi:hypothetical protein
MEFQMAKGKCQMGAEDNLNFALCHLLFEIVLCLNPGS